MKNIVFALLMLVGLQAKGDTHLSHAEQQVLQRTIVENKLNEGQIIKAIPLVRVYVAKLDSLSAGWLDEYQVRSIKAAADEFQRQIKALK